MKAAFCIEHNLPLNNGVCPKCRDSNGRPFVLDMQSYYLAEVSHDFQIQPALEIDIHSDFEAFW